MNDKDIRELNALVSLADEPNDDVFEGIADKILSFGSAAVPILIERCLNSFDPLVLERLPKVIHQINFEALCHHLENTGELSVMEMVDIAIRLARLEYFDLDEDDLMKKIEAILRDIWLEVNEQLSGPEKIELVNRTIYEKHGFSGNSDDLYNIKNSYLNTLLETHKGSAVSLGILYIIIARHLRLPVYGVNLPQQFILAFMEQPAGGGMQEEVGKEVLFYINPFFRGAMFSKREVERYLMDIKVSPEEKHFLPCSNLDIIRCLVNNLIVDYSKIKKEQKVKELERIAKILDK